MKKLSHLFAVLLAAFALSACTNDADGLPPEDSGIALTYSVAPPPAFTGIIESKIDVSQTSPGRVAPGTLPARSAIDLPTGKITWEKGDKVYAGVVFYNKTDTEISNQRVILTRGDTDWMPDRSVVWPVTAAKAQIYATYIGTAKPGEAAVNQPVYNDFLAIAAGEPVEITFDTHQTTYLAISGLQPGDVVKPTGNRWMTFTLKDDHNLYAGPMSTTITADANGQVDIFAYLYSLDYPLTITITRSGIDIATDLDLQLPGVNAEGGNIDYRGQLIPISINTGQPGGVDPGAGM